MQISTSVLLEKAQAQGYAIGAFNVYNLEGVRAVIAAAEAERSPVILQVHPAALRLGGRPLVISCLSAARDAGVPVSVHLDHGSVPEDIRAVLSAGVASVMADGSALPFLENLTFTREMAELAHRAGACVEAELGRLSGTEDGLTVPEREACLTDPLLAAQFVSATGVDCLAVCVGNVHGACREEPHLDFDRLAAIQERVPVPLVLHGASGLPAEAVGRAIELGVAKFNVNTELRNVYLDVLKSGSGSSKAPDLLDLMSEAVTAMQAVVAEKLRLFNSRGRAAEADMILNYR